MLGTVEFVDAQHLGHDTAHLGRSIELSFALAAFSRKILHQILVGIAQQVIVGGTVSGEVESVVLKDGYQFGQGLDHCLAAAQFVRVVEVGKGKVTYLSGIHFLDSLQLLVDEFAYLAVLLQGYKVLKAAFLWHFQAEARLSCLVGQVLYKENDEHIVLVLAGIHGATQGVARFP